MGHRARRHSTWLPIAQLITLLGFVLAVEHWGLALMVACSFTIALFSWGILGTMWGDGGISELPRIARRGLAVGAMATAFAGLATTLGIASVLVAVALAVSHPQVREMIGKGRRALTRPGSTVPKPENHRDLSDDALCAVWQTSHAWLHSATTPTAQAEVVQLRQDYLDELERRHPDGFAAWLASGAPAADNMRRFLSQSGQSEHPEPGAP